MLPGISIIITTHNQCEVLHNHLPSFLEQDYAGDFEVIVVDQNSTDDTMPYLDRMEGRYANLHIISTPGTARNISIQRMALTLGVRAASYEWVMLTQADCQPASPRWLTKMSEACNNDKTKIVLGYTQMANGKGWHGLRYRFLRTWQQINNISWTRGHAAYRCDGTNLCYRRDFFLENKGFADNTNLQLGATDILVNRNSTHDNTRYVVCPDAIVMQDTPRYYRTWVQERMFFVETRRHFRHSASFLLRRFVGALATWLPTLLAISAIIWGIANADIITPIVALVLWFGLIAYRTYRINKQFQTLGEPQIWFAMPLLIHLVSIWDIQAWIVWLFTKRQTFEKKYI